jgi:uncharacterized membrane protein YjgN (DUF898 family)
MTEESKLRPLSFTGDGREYFGIWIVNLALTVVTLGVYSAWAKVRRLQYFYRHTRLDGFGFDYHGQPIAILKGRIVGFGLFLLYTFAIYSRPLIALAVFGALAAVMPWLLSKSLRFRLYNSSYRGLRFRFHGATRSAYWVFLALPILTVLSLMALGPFWHHRIKRYLHANAAYGRTMFTFSADVSEFYLTYVAAVALSIGVFVGLIGLVVIGVLVAGVGAGDAPLAETPDMTMGQMMIFLLPAFVYVTGVLGVQAFVTARLQNAVWNRTRLKDQAFVCEIKTMRLFGILFSNLFLTVLTLGLYRPFAQVQLARYMASVFCLAPSGSFDEFLASEQQELSAVGEETAELFDFDIAP